MQDDKTYVLLHALKYGEKSLIIKTLSQKGVQSFFLQNYLKKGKNAYPFLSWPLSIIEIEDRLSAKSGLPFVKTLSLSYVPSNITTDIIRQSIALFMADVLYHTIYAENDQLESVYDYVLNAIYVLDKSAFISGYFPVKFGFDMSELLGYGLSIGKPEMEYYNEKEMRFQEQSSHDCVHLNSSKILKRILSNSLSEIDKIEYKSSEAKELFALMLKFFKKAIPEAGLLKSPKVLHGLFK